MAFFSIFMDDNEQVSFGVVDSRQKEKRAFKGSSVNKHVDDYCILDLETTGVFVGSSKIIEISALKVRNNQVVDQFSTLVNPHCHIPAQATAINHITDNMVKNAPSLINIIDAFLSFVKDDVIVGYNNAAFDMNLIYDNALELKGVLFRNDYIDLLHAARRSLEGLENYKLKTISEHYGLNTEGEHRALKDCYLTKCCYDKLFEDFGDAAFRRRKHSFAGSGKGIPGKGIQYSSETIALQELHKILCGMLEDGKISLEEVDSLRFWLEEHRDLSGHYPFDKAFDALDAALEDGIITPNELSELQKIFAEITNPVKSHGCHEAIPTLKEKHVCLTGEFNYGKKSIVEEMIIAAGGVVDKGVKKATNYLVVGAQGSDAWKTGSYGGKIQKAMELKAKGTAIEIIEEDDFIPRIQYLIAHPEENEEECGTAPSEAFVSGAWKNAIQSMLDSMVIEKGLPEQSLYLLENYGRDGMKITSYSVCIYEPDYPVLPNETKDSTRNSVVLNIKEAKERLELLITTAVFDAVDAPVGAEIKQLKSDLSNTHVLFPMDSDELVLYVKKITEYELAHYVSKTAAFGCCGRYLECSNAQKCIHENKLYSKACMYRKQLESGRIFYGMNRNN